MISSFSSDLLERLYFFISWWRIKQETLARALIPSRWRMDQSSNRNLETSCNFNPLGMFYCASLIPLTPAGAVSHLSLGFPETPQPETFLSSRPSWSSDWQQSGAFSLVGMKPTLVSDTSIKSAHNPLAPDFILKKIKIREWIFCLCLK